VNFNIDFNALLSKHI